MYMYMYRFFLLLFLLVVVVVVLVRVLLLLFVLLSSRCTSAVSGNAKERAKSIKTEDESHAVCSRKL